MLVYSHGYKNHWHRVAKHWNPCVHMGMVFHQLLTSSIIDGILFNSFRWIFILKICTVWLFFVLYKYILNTEFPVALCPSHWVDEFVAFSTFRPFLISSFLSYLQFFIINSGQNFENTLHTGNITLLNTRSSFFCTRCSTNI